MASVPGLVASERVEAAISVEYLRAVVERLESFRSHPLGFRVAGTPEERAATAYIAGELGAAGLADVAEEPVPVDAWRLLDAYVVAGGRRYECASFGGVPETGPDGVSGELVFVGRGGRRQLDGLDVSGAVALVEWEDEALWPYQVGLELGLRGAAAMILAPAAGGPYYQAPGALGTFDGLWHAEGPPLVTIRREDALDLVQHAGKPVEVVLSAPLTPGAEAANVVGVLPGRRRRRPLLVGGHHDGWFGGAFDDASAVAITLALARAFAGAGLRPQHPIVFISHTAEEYGIAHSLYDWCYGAWYQIVVEHPEWARASPFYLNVEGCATHGDPFTVDAPPELAGWSERVCTEAERDGLLPHGWKLGAPTTWTEVWPFLAAGVPAVNVSTFTDEYERTEYHTQYDVSASVDFDYLERLARVCARFLLAADAAGDDLPDYGARASHVRSSLDGLRRPRLERALEGLESAHGRQRFTALARGVHGLDAKEGAGYPHAQTARDVARLDAALAAIAADDASGAADQLAGIGLNRLCADLSERAFGLELARRGRDVPRATWAALGDPDVGPNLWRELASLRGEPGARPPGPWIAASLTRHLAAAQRRLARRLDRMAAAIEGRTRPLPKPRDLPAPPERSA